MAIKKRIHLAQFLVHGPSYHSLAMWRHPRTAYTRDNWARPQLYQHIAQVCERGLFDMALFDMALFADLNYISDTFRGSLEPVWRSCRRTSMTTPPTCRSTPRWRSAPSPSCNA
jgi:hypothetical protein